MIKHVLRLALFFLALVIAFSACAPAPSGMSIQPTLTPLSMTMQIQTSTPEPSATPRPTVTPLPTPTLTQIPTRTPIPPMQMINACGESDKPNYVVALGQRAAVHLASGESRPYCVTTKVDWGSSSRLPDWTVALGDLPQPELLRDQDGSPLEYLGVVSYAFAWRRANGDLLILPALYPKWIGSGINTGGTQIAPILVWRGGDDQRILTGWQLDLIGVREGRPLLTFKDPFIPVDESHAVKFIPDSKSDEGDIAAHYELVEKGPGNSSDNIIGQQVGLPLRIPTLFLPTNATVTNYGFTTVLDAKFRLQTAIFDGSEQPVGMLGEIPIDLFTDEKGQLLTFIGIRGYTFAWGNPDGSSLRVPALYPSTYEGVAVAPIFLCPHCADSRVLANWQVWLLNIKTGETVKVIEHPFVILAKGETVIFNPDSGHLEIVAVSEAGSSPTGKQIGFPLPRMGPVGVVHGIRLFQFPKEDVAKFERVLSWMNANTPRWYQSIVDQRPLDIYFDPGLRALGYGGRARLPTPSGNEDRVTVRATIWIVYHPPNNPSDDVYFLETLVHEATHIYNRRADLPFTRPSYGSATRCRENEGSAVEAEISFLSDLLNAQIDSKMRSAAERYLRYKNDILAKGTFDWNPACQ